jgi:hypothetical protein
MCKTQFSECDYTRYRVAQPKEMGPMTISFDRLEDLRLVRLAGSPKALSNIVRAEAARLRATGGYGGSLSAATLRATRAKLAAAS